MKFRFSKFILLFFLSSYQMCFAQEKYSALTVGSNVRGLPAFENVVNYGDGKLSLDKFLGKLIIIDFWSTGCPSCIASMPHLETLQEEFKGKIQIILVNPWETKEKIEQRISKMRILRRGIGLTSLPNVYGDVKWRFIFPHSSLPHHIWINSKGTVIASSSGINTTREHILEVLNGKKLNLSIKNDLLSRGYDVRKMGIMRGGDSSIVPLFYSSITKANHGFGSGSQVTVDTLKNVFKQNAYNESVLSLIQIACRGYHVSLEVKDKGSFYRPKDPNKFDAWFENNCFSYEIALPLSVSDSVFSYMRSDLNRFFSANKNIQLVSEKRRYPTYVLKKIASQQSTKLIKAQAVDTIGYKILGKHFDKTFNEVRKYLEQNLQDLSISVPIPFVDETNIADNEDVSIYLPTDFTNISKLESTLRLQGFNLSIEDRELGIYVLRDISIGGK